MIRRDFLKTTAAVAVLPFLGDGGRVKGDYRMAAVTKEGEFLWFPGVYRTESENGHKFEFRGELIISKEKAIIVASAITDASGTPLSVAHFGGGPFTVYRDNTVKVHHTIAGAELLGHPDTLEQAQHRLAMVKWR